MSHFDILPFPPSRETVVDAGYLGSRRHIAHGLVEVDVTRARELARLLSARDSTKISFTAFIVASLGRAIASNPQVQAYRDWRRRLIIFSDHHKGTGDEADDFQPSEPSYQGALEYYLESGHTLVVLGDVEELWEDPPGPVLERYTSVLNKENDFHRTSSKNNLNINLIFKELVLKILEKNGLDYTRLL